MSEKKFAVFDIDGTLIRWQLYHAVVGSLAKDGLLGNDADKTLKAARMEWKRRVDPEAFRKYELTLIDIFESSFHDIDPGVFDEHVRRVIEEYHDQTYTYTRELVSKLKQEGYFLLAISGSPEKILEILAPEYQFDDFVGSHYAEKNGKFTGEITVPGHDKRRHLKQLIEKHNLSFGDSVAVGDSASDIPMLEMVACPIAFNPDRRLFEAAREKGWKIVIERKNVVYELDSGNGKYVLV